MVGRICNIEPPRPVGRGAFFALDTAVDIGAVLSRSWTYDRGGRPTERDVKLGGAPHALATTFTYDASGRSATVTTAYNGTNAYHFGVSTGGYDAGDRLTDYSETASVGASYFNGAVALTYDDSTGRLRRAIRGARTDQWTYDVFGNRATTYWSTTEGGESLQGPGSCNGAANPSSYGPDNALRVAHSTPACSTYHHYWNDRTGARLAATDSLGTGYTAIESQLTYTAAGQLYYAITKTPSAGGEYDYTWTWYDGSGSRVMAVQGHGDSPAPQDPHDYWARRLYFLPDGPNVELQLGPDGVLERHVMAGLDAPVAVRRYDDSGNLLGTWTLVSDRQGTTLGALDSLGAQIAAAQAVSHNPFGAVEGLAPAGSNAPTSGYTGAAQSVSNGGGMVYLRNRWYDPATGRFLTQDPIGLAGGVNLYAYAGNDPVAFTDPFGLCPSCLTEVIRFAVAHPVAAERVTRLVHEEAAGFACGSQGFQNCAVPPSGSFGALLGQAALALGAKAPVGAAVPNAAVAAEPAVTAGIYEFAEGEGTYVGQSGNIPSRLSRHISDGRVSPDGAAAAKRTYVPGGKTAREIAEQRRIDDLGGVNGGRVTNKVNPIGAKRQYLMNDNWL